MSLGNLSFENNYNLYIDDLRSDTLNSTDVNGNLFVGDDTTRRIDIGTPTNEVWINGQRFLGGGPIGPTGPVGNTGPKGDTGVQGIPGTSASKGDTGATGAMGPIGNTGPIGATGNQGNQGNQGIKGDTGPQGPNGILGLQGPTGPKGDTGANGIAGTPGLIGPTGPQGSAANAWNLTGNAGTVTGTNYIGASDNKSIIIATNGGAGNNRLQITNNGRIEPFNAFSSTYFGSGAGGLGGGSNCFFGGGCGNVCNASFSSGFGFGALGSLVSGGGYACAFGMNAGLNVTTGNTNTLIGYSSGSPIITGAGNTMVGANSGAQVGSTCGNTIIIGTNQGTNTDTNLIRIGNGQVKNFTAGIRNVVPDVDDGIPVYITSGNQLVTNGSSTSTFTLNTTMSGPFASTAVAFKFTRIGKICYLEIPLVSVQVTVASQPIITPINIIPSQYRPVTTGFGFRIPVRAGSTTNSIGDGTLYFAVPDTFIIRSGTESPFGAIGTWAGLYYTMISYLVA